MPTRRDRGRRGAACVILAALLCPVGAHADGEILTATATPPPATASVTPTVTPTRIPTPKGAVCTAQDIVALDPSCPPNNNTCTIDEHVLVGDGCVIDFGGRPVAIAAKPALDVGAGSFTLRAASLTIGALGSIEGVSVASIGFGGHVRIETTGPVILQRLGVQRGFIDVSGQEAAGSIDIVASDINVAGALIADSLTLDGDGGRISITTSGVIATTADGLLSATGGDRRSTGGRIDVRSDGAITAEGDLNVRGGADGGVVMASAGGAISIARVKADGKGNAGNGGQVLISAGTSLAATDDITVRGEDDAFSKQGGRGGTVRLEASFGDLAVAGVIGTDGAIPVGDGGTIDLRARGDIAIGGALSVHAVKGAVNGGRLGLDAGGAIDVNAVTDIGNDGSFTASAGRDVHLRQRINGANAATVGDGASVDVLSSGGSVVVASTIDARGAGCSGGRCSSGGSVSLEGCALSIEADAQILAAAPNGGHLTFTSHEQMVIDGTADASGTAATAALQYRADGPAPQVHKPVQPSPVLVAADLLPCPTCGNGIVEFPEECDNDVGAPPLGCDGCSPFCTFEICAAGPGDACDPRLGCHNGEITATPTITATVTQSPTVTPTVPTATPTESPTVTPSPTITPTGAAPPSVSPQPTSSTTPGRMTPTPTQTRNRTPSVTPTPNLPGDLDGSGQVDAADVDLLIGALFLPAPPSGADANVDGFVGSADVIRAIEIAFAP